MVRCRIAGLAVLAALAAGGVAAAQPAPAVGGPPDEIICVGSEYWRATLADNRDIAAIPVPAGYREQLQSPDACIRSTLHRASLVNWHLESGSEASAAAALAFLEAHLLRDLVPPARFAGELRRRWRAALPDLGRPPSAEERSVDVGDLQLLTRESQAVVDLLALLDGRERLLFLAEQYLRAAEEFRSAPLLDKSELFLEPALASARFLEPLAQRPPASSRLGVDLNRVRTDDLRMRTAVLRARISRSPADRARAEAIVASLDRPLYAAAADAAFGGGPAFCDLDPRAARRAEIAAACTGEEAFQERVTSWWVARALLDLDAAAEIQPSRELAMRLLKLETGELIMPRCCNRSSREDVLRLLVAGAENSERRLDSALARADGSDGAGNAWRDALAQLEAAERMLEPYSEPGRFRRIARAWLALWARGDRPGVRDRRWPDLAASPRDHRLAAYLRHLLAALDAIAVGAAPAGG